MINELHLMDNQKGIAKLADKSVNLIIADPPYYKIKGDFDFEFKDFQEYLDFMEDQAKLCKKVLADNGSLFVYGHAKNIAYVQIIFDKYFNLENNIVWYKPDSRTKKGIGIYRCFAPSTERILFYSNETQRTGLEEIKLDVNNFKSLRNYFEQVQKFIGINLKKINEILCHRKAEHCFYWNSTQWDLPIKEVYFQLIEKFNINKMIGFREYEDLRREYEDLRREYEDLRREYEDLRREYEDLRRPFNNKKNYEDVISINQEMHLYNSFDHDTIKPEKLTLDLIETTTKENDIVLIPFGGSGTECVCSMRLKRQWIAFENKKKYFDIAIKRIHSEYEKTSLFNSLGGRQLQLSA